MKIFMSSSTPQPATPPNYLLRVPRHPSCSTEPFVLEVGDVADLNDSIDKDRLKPKENMKLSHLMEMFEWSLEAALTRRGLLWEKPLSDEEKCWLIFEYHKITGSYHRIFTTYDLTGHLIELPIPYRRPFLDSLSKMKAIVIIDWSTKFNTRVVGIDMYDHGTKIPDHNVWYKGESDGSYDAKVKLEKAGEIIWRGNQVCLCEAYFDLPCCSSVQSEVKGMYLQLKRGMPLQYLIACMDCMAIFNVVRGFLVDDQGGSRGMYEVLKSMRGGFK
jgi:hypothetical protein